MLKICVMSDLHGNFINIQPCELVLICGDIIPLKMQRNIPQSLSWFKKKFIPWVEALPCEEVVFIAGNHDYFLQSAALEVIELIKDTKITYLENSYYNYLSKDAKLYKIYGTPDCHIFGNWPFMYSDEHLKESYSKIPENCDIIIAHDAPYGVSDICFEAYWNERKNVGNEPLREIILDKSPSYLFHGHLHSSNHELEYLGDTKVYNTSILGEDYSIKYSPLYLDI